MTPAPLHALSLPIETIMPAQLPATWSVQVQEPQTWLLVKPVFQSLRDVPAGQVCAPSKSWHAVAAEGSAGTHTRPTPQPAPIEAVAQNVPVAVQLGGVAIVGLPDGVHAGAVAVKMLASMPKITIAR